MSRPLKFLINNKKYNAKEGETILDVALKNNIEIPHLCKHPDLEIKGNCRTCLVEVEGMGIVTSCSTKVELGMKVKTDSEKKQQENQNKEFPKFDEEAPLPYLDNEENKIQDQNQDQVTKKPDSTNEDILDIPAFIRRRMK